MKKLTVSNEYSTIKLDKYIKTKFPLLPHGALYKALRKRDIKVNGLRVKEDYIVKSGDVVEIYIVDSILEGHPSFNDVTIPLQIVFEDENLLIINKEQGISVHPDLKENGESVIEKAQKYLLTSNSFECTKTAYLCHRLDRNTGGLLIIAKNKLSRDEITYQFQERSIKKYYHCLVRGSIQDQIHIQKAFLYKNERKSLVTIFDSKKNNTTEIITKFKPIEYFQWEKEPTEYVTKLEVELITGKTHQIRAHMAFLGHPILGDGKYGSNQYNRMTGFKIQALWAVKLKLFFSPNSHLYYLNGSEFTTAEQFKIKGLKSIKKCT